MLLDLTRESQFSMTWADNLYPRMLVGLTCVRLLVLDLEDYGHFFPSLDF